MGKQLFEKTGEILCQHPPSSSVHEGAQTGSVVECLTPDRGVVGSSLTSVTALCP